jgi:hypothetical protein
MKSDVGDAHDTPALDLQHVGAYGLVVHGLPGATEWMQPQPDDAPHFDMVIDHTPKPYEGGSTLNDASARIRLIGGGLLEMTRDTPTAHFTLPVRPPDEELLHPYLAPAAALFWQWHGHEALHAGVFCVNGSAILLLGDKEAGKSTTLGWLATEGATTVLSDDLAVVHGPAVAAGPRSIDLRPGSATTTASHHVVRDGRHRITLAPCPSLVPLVGVACLAWSDTLALSPVHLRDRMGILARQRTFPSLPADPVAMLDLCSLPMITAARPRDLAALPSFAQALVAFFS